MERKERRALQREQRKSQNRAIAQGRHEISRRNFLIGGTVGAAGLAAAVLLARDQLFQESSPTFNSATNESVNTEFSENDFNKQASKAIDDYKRILAPDIDKNFILENLIFVPNHSTLSPSGKEELCPQQVCLMASGYAGTATPNQENPKMYISKDALDQKYALSKQRASGASPALLKAYTAAYARQVIIHEIVHFTSVRNRYAVSPELDEMIRKYANSILVMPYEGKKFSENFTEGFKVTFAHPESRVPAVLFKGVEEGFASAVEIDMSRLTVENHLFVQEEAGDFERQYLLMANLLRSLPPDTIKRLIEARNNRNSLDLVIRLAGQEFEAETDKQFEKGFQIVMAIDRGDETLYRQLTTKK